MSTNTFLKLGDIEGESTISGFEKPAPPRGRPSIR